MARAKSGEQAAERLLFDVRPGDEWTNRYSTTPRHARTVAAYVRAAKPDGSWEYMSDSHPLYGVKLSCYQSTDYVNDPAPEAASQFSAQVELSGTGLDLRQAERIAKTLGRIARALEKAREAADDGPRDWAEYLMLVGKVLGVPEVKLPADRYSQGQPIILPLARCGYKVRALLGDWRAAEREAKYRADFPVVPCIECGELHTSRAGEAEPRCQACAQAKSERDHAAWLAEYHAKQAAKASLSILLGEPAAE